MLTTPPGRSLVARTSAKVTAGSGHAAKRELVDELVGAAFEHFGDAIEDLPAVVGGFSGPARLRGTGDDDRLAEIFPRAETDVRDRLALRTFQQVIPPRFGAREF